MHGTLVWPQTFSAQHPVIILRGDNGRIFYADVAAAEQRTRAPITAGTPLVVLGVEGAQPQLIVAKVVSRGDATALALSLFATPVTVTPPSPLPAVATAPSAPSAVAPPEVTLPPIGSLPPAPPPSLVFAPVEPAAPTVATPAPTPPADPTPTVAAPPASEKSFPDPKTSRRWVEIEGVVQSVDGKTVTLLTDDGQIVTLDASALTPTLPDMVRPGARVSAFGTPVELKFKAMGFVEPDRRR
jgi:hypothetical protein